MDVKKPYLIGLTGGIGSGKSSVAASLSKRTGFIYIDADIVAKDIFSQEGAALDSLRAILGDQFFFPSGALDRKLLRKAIFSDSLIKQRVDDFSHPLIWNIIKQKALDASKIDKVRVIVEVPLLFEAGWPGRFNKTVVVYANQHICRARLASRDSLCELETGLAIASQMPIYEKVMQADHVINNSGNWSETLLQISSLSEILMGKSA